MSVCFSQCYRCVQCLYFLSVYQQGLCWPWEETEWMSCLINLVLWINWIIPVQNHLINWITRTGQMIERALILEALTREAHKLLKRSMVAILQFKPSSFREFNGLDRQNSISNLATSFKSCFLQSLSKWLASAGVRFTGFLRLERGGRRCASIERFSQQISTCRFHDRLRQLPCLSCRYLVSWQILVHVHL